MTARLAGIIAGLGLALTGVTVVAAEPAADVCLQTAPGTLTEAEWAAAQAAVVGVVNTRSQLFPSPSFTLESDRLDIDSGPWPPPDRYAPCLEPGAQWSARLGRAFLEAGAERMLEEAPTTPGIDSAVTLEWYPDEARVRTRLHFAGPLDIPNGTCWIDDALSVDEATGTIMASGEQGLETSPFAEGACGRFFDHLPDGGAGEQAVTLLPSVVALDDGGELRFVAEGVRVTDDAVSIWGRLDRS